MKTISITALVVALLGLNPGMHAATAEANGAPQSTLPHSGSAGTLPRAVASSGTNAIVVTPDFLAQLSEEIRTNNPGLKAADARANSATLNVKTVRTWEDPMVELGGMAAEEMMRAEDGDIIYGVEQKLPLFGKPKLARRLAGAEAEVEAANSEYQFQKLRSEFAQAAFRAALANEVVKTGEEDLSWLELMTRTVESKYRAAEATLFEVLQLQNELSKRSTALQTDRNQLSHELVTLNRFLNRDQQSPWPGLQLPDPAPSVEFNNRLVDFALKYEPRSQVMRQEIKEAEAMVAVTRRSRLPDVNVGLEARNYSDDGSFRQGMLSFSMSLPWINARKYRNEIRRDEQKLKATELELADYQSELREELHLITIKADAARREALLYRNEILPRTQAALETTRAGWEANRASVRDLLDARRMLVEARLMYARAVSEQYQMLSDLVLCCGLGDLNALQMLSAEVESKQPSAESKPQSPH